MRGHLSPWLFVECARCGTRRDVSETGNRQDAMRILRQSGWRQNYRDLLWSCPDCGTPKRGLHETP